MRNYLLIVPVVGCALLSSSASAFGGLLTNGDFEQFNPNGSNFRSAGTDYWCFNAGSNALNGWSIGGTSIDIVTGTYTHFDRYGVDLAGSPGPGSISQNVATNGALYEISFYACFTGDLINSQLDLTFGSFNTVVTLDGTFHQYTYLVTPGTGASTLFKMATDPSNGTNGNEFIDNVQVRAVPEPFSMSLIGGSALLGFLRMRRRRA